MVLNRNKPEERKEKILFINASREFEQHPEVRKLNRLGEGQIEKIVAAYRDFKEEEGFARIVDTESIREKHNYNLNVTLYVFPETEREEIDIDKEWKEIKSLDREIDMVTQKIEGYLKELQKA